jgi:hypothetical protein
MRRGHWPDPLPSSCSLRWWHLLFTAGREESQSRVERSADECSAPPPHPGAVPSPSGEYPFSPRKPSIDPSSCKVGGSGLSSTSAIASLHEVLKAGPLCQQRILDPKKISAMALNSTHRERRTSLILYRGAVVMPRCYSKARSLPARIGDSALKDSTSSASRYIFSGSVSLEGGCSSSILSSVPWSSGCCSVAGES